MVMGSFAQMRALRANTDASQDRVAMSGAVAVQAISGIRTVTAFGMNNKLLSLYSQALQRPMELGIQSGLLKGITLGVSQFISLSSYGLLFWYGSVLVLNAPPEERGSAFQHMLRSLMAVRFVCVSIFSSFPLSLLPSFVIRVYCGKVSCLESHHPLPLSLPPSLPPSLPGHHVRAKHWSKHIFPGRPSRRQLCCCSYFCSGGPPARD